MMFKRLTLLLILLTLAGCYQQVPDTFESVSSAQNLGAQNFNPTETDSVPMPEMTAEVIQVEPSPTLDAMPFMPTETPTLEEMPFMPTETPTLEVLPFMPTETPTSEVMVIVPETETPTSDPLFLAFTETPTSDPLFLAFTETPTLDPLVLALSATPEPPTNTPEPAFAAFTATFTPSATIAVIQLEVTATPISATATPATGLEVQVSPQGQVITPQPPVQMVFPSLTPDINRGDGSFGGVNATPSGLVTPTALAEFDDRCVYIVKAGDTLFRIAQNNNIALSALFSLNNLNERSIIQPGQQLRLPLTDCVGATSPTPAAPAPAITSTPLPSGTTSYTIQAGDTIASLARRFGTTIEAIVQANALVNPNRLSIGQTLIIPTGGR